TVDLAQPTVAPYGEDSHTEIRGDERAPAGWRLAQCGKGLAPGIVEPDSVDAPLTDVDDRTSYEAADDEPEPRRLLCHHVLKPLPTVTLLTRTPRPQPAEGTLVYVEVNVRIICSAILLGTRLNTDRPQPRRTGAYRLATDRPRPDTRERT